MPETLLQNGGDARAVINNRLNTLAFHQLSGLLSGLSFVKIVFDRSNGALHFINSRLYKLHAIYIAENILGMTSEEMRNRIDEFNEKFYREENRRFCLGILTWHINKMQESIDDKSFLTLETTEVDIMGSELMVEFYKQVNDNLDMIVPLFWKPANHTQELLCASIDSNIMAKMFSRELYSKNSYVPLNPGEAIGRLRVFINEQDYLANRTILEWYDIIVMPRVPDDIPRLAGIINAEQTAPLSHTNVLANGWQIPNAVQIGIIDKITEKNLNETWVNYVVNESLSEVTLTPVTQIPNTNIKPVWANTRIKIEEPEVFHTPILPLEHLRNSDRFRYGTKAANLGEVYYILRHGSSRLHGFYALARPPRKDLLPYLRKFLGVDSNADIEIAVRDFLNSFIKLPRGIAIPFSYQREFLEGNPELQQHIGMLKMALELKAKQTDSLCIKIQQLIRQTRISNAICEKIDKQIIKNLSGCSTFVVRSSSNAEDLSGFSAAGIYESVNHVTSAQTIFESIKTVWASLVSPRSVRLRQEVGISLDDSYMGVIVQEEVPATLGGVMVTVNPAITSDFRNIYINASKKSVQHVVKGDDIPLQYLFNAVEGEGRTLSLGSSNTDISNEQYSLLQKLAFAGKLLQGHFSGDYTFSHPVDIEWIMNENIIYLLQLRPFGN